jgi:hypothetical protein
MASWKRITGAKYGFEGKGITKRGRKRTDKKKKIMTMREYPDIRQSQMIRLLIIKRDHEQDLTERISGRNYSEK